MPVRSRVIYAAVEQWRTFMNRDEYMADEHVAGFTKWAGQLVTGDLRLAHRWKSRGTDFECASLFGALEQYRWPDNSHALDHRVTARRFREFRLNFRGHRYHRQPSEAGEVRGQCRGRHQVGRDTAPQEAERMA